MRSLHTSRSMTHHKYVRRDVLTAVLLKMQDFWAIELSRLCMEFSVSNDLVPSSGMCSTRERRDFQDECIAIIRTSNYWTALPSTRREGDLSKRWELLSQRQTATP
jgi:hypothetical protein